MKQVSDTIQLLSTQSVPKRKQQFTRVIIVSAKPMYTQLNM